MPRRAEDLFREAVAFGGGRGSPVGGSSIPSEGPLTRGSSSDGSSESIDDDDDDESLESESQKSFDIEVTPTPEEQEQEKYKALSPDFDVLINEEFDQRRDYCSVELWTLLERLALPETKRYLTRYIRHCTFAAETWLSRIIQYHTSTERGRATERPALIIPPEFDTVIRPLIEQIVKKVRRRRWKCSISKKYLDSLCMYTLCPTFFYDTKQENKPHKRSDEETSRFHDIPRAASPLAEGVLRVSVPDRQSGDSFRRVSREVNISADQSSESCSLVPLLWQLELRLIAILYLDSEWIQDETTVRCFPHLGDSRVLFSVYRQEECNRPILSYNVNQIRNALGRLYTRWNDLAPSRDLYYYFCFLRDRVALLSISSLCATIERKFLGRSSLLESTLDGVSTNPAGNPPGRTTPSSRLDQRSKTLFDGISHVPRAINPIYAFGKYVGNNLKDTVESITGVPATELDSLLSKTPTVTRSFFSSSGNTLTSEESTYEMEEAERLRLAEEKSTKNERMAYQRRKRLYKRLTRRQKLSEIVNEKISDDNRSTFGSIVEKGDHRNKDDEEGEMFLGDVHEETSIVKNALRRLGGDIFSSSEEEEGSDEGVLEEYEDEEGTLGKVLKKGKKKKKHEEINTASGSGANASTGVLTDENFFHHYADQKGQVYSQLGETIKDEDICAEVVTHHLIASVKNDTKGGTANHPRLESDGTALFSDVFLSCLTTDSFLTTQTVSSALPKVKKTVKCITRTNESFIMETHALMSQIEQEIQCWNTLDVLESFTEEDGKDSTPTSVDTMPWKSTQNCIVDDDGGSGRLFLDVGISEDSSDPIAMMEYAIEFERCKIENVLKMCYSFSRGKRNQFISRNIREESFCHFLNPGEPEFLLLVCGLKNSSIVPSIIVSRLRQNDVDRLAKIIDEKKVYKMIEEFAEFNELNIREKNIASHKHAKQLFEYRCCEKKRDVRTMLDHPPPPGEEGSSSRHRVSPTEIYSLIRQFSHVSLSAVLDTHLANQTIPMEDFQEPERKDDDVYSIFPTKTCLQKMYKHEKSCRFLSPDISVPWQSPRGLVRVVRSILIRCIHYYMKEISHLIDARSFFFNSWMTVKLCNNPTFINLYDMRENILLQSQEESVVCEEGEEESVTEHEEGSVVYEGEEEERIPTREEIARLFSETCSSEQELSSVEPEEAPSPHKLPEPLIFSFTPDFTSFMRARAEGRFMDFYFRCPVVLQCMTGSFLWNPSTCTTKECVGADSLLGLHSWLYEMTQHISSELIPELLVQNAFYLESSKSQTWTSPVDGGTHGFEHEVDTLAVIYSSTRYKYKDSPYKDEGMHYKYLLMLLSNMPSFGNLGMYCTLVQHLCTFVVHMDVMMFPHILETFSIHMQGPPNEREKRINTLRTGGQDGPSHGTKRPLPVDPTIQYIESSRGIQHEEASRNDEPEGVSIYYPKHST